MVAKNSYFKTDFINNIYKAQLQVIIDEIKKMIAERIPNSFSIESQKHAHELFCILENESIPVHNDLFKIKPDVKFFYFSYIIFILYKELID